MAVFYSDAVLERMRRIYEFSSNRELAAYFAVSDTTIQAVVFVGNLAQGGAATNASVTQHAGENAYNVGGDFNFNQK